MKVRRTEESKERTVEKKVMKRRRGWTKWMGRKENGKGDEEGMKRRSFSKRCEKRRPEVREGEKEERKKEKDVFSRSHFAPSSFFSLGDQAHIPFSLFPLPSLLETLANFFVSSLSLFLLSSFLFFLPTFSPTKFWRKEQGSNGERDKSLWTAINS